MKLFRFQCTISHQLTAPDHQQRCFTNAKNPKKNNQSLLLEF